MFNKDDEDEEKRKKEADFIINSINPNQEENISNSINSINYANSNNINLNLQNDTDKLFVDRVNEANSIIDSINPRKNIKLPKPSNQELQKSKENTQKFLDLIDDKQQENTEKYEQTQNIDDSIIGSTNYNKASPQQRIAVDVLLNKRTMDEAKKNVEYSNIKVEQPKEKGNLLNNIKSFFDNLFLGASSGMKQNLKYIENANEQNFANYKNIRENQYMTSPNVSLEDKATQNLSNNMLLDSNEDKFIQLANKNIKDYGTLENPLYNTENKETNLVKKGFQDSIDKDTLKIQENINNTNGKISKKLVELAPSIGQMTVGWGVSAINPVLGISYFMTSSGGSYIDDAKNRGMNDEEAFKYGTIMGAMEGITEEIGVSKLVKGGKAISKGFIQEALKNYALNATDNFIQEAVIEPISEATATIVGGKETADWDNITGRMLSSGIDGALTALIMDGASAGINSSIRIVDKIKNNENVSQTEIKNAIKDINDNENIDVENTIKDEMNYQIQKVSDVNDYMVARYNEESDNLELYEVKGEAINIDNNKLNITPAVVNIDGFYNVIDSNSGLELYTTKNSNKKEVIAEFKRQINGLDNASIKNINTKVAQTKLEVMNKFQKMQENPQTIQDFNIQQNENLYNKDNLNNISQDNVNQIANPKAKNLRLAIEQIQDNSYYNTERTNEIMKIMSDNFDNVTYTPKGKGSIFAIKNNKGQTVYSKEIRNNIGYSGKNIKNILSNVYNSVMQNDDADANTNQKASEPNTSDFYTNETNYAVKDIKKVTEPFNKQEYYSKDEMTDIWNNKVFNQTYDAYFDKDGNIERYIAIEEDGDNIVVNQYDNNDNIVKSEVIPVENGRYSSKVIKDIIDKVASLQDKSIQTEKNNIKNNKTHNKTFENEIKKYKKISKEKNIINGKILEININIFEGISKKKQSNFLNEFLKYEVRGQDYFVDGQKIIANNTTIGKLKNGRTNFNKKIDKDIRQELKANIIGNLENVIKISRIYQKNRPDTKDHSFADTFDRRKSLISYKNETYEIMFEIGKKENLNTLYSIENIKKIGRVTSGISHNETSKTPNKGGKSTQPKTNITQKTKIVKDTPSNIQDFGEKIGGARKDLAQPRTETKITKEVTHDYTVATTENGYSVNFKNKILKDGFKMRLDAEQYILDFKENIKNNMAFVEEGSNGKDEKRYAIKLRNPRTLKSEYTSKVFKNRLDAESYAIALSIYLKEHGKNLFRPQIQKVERINPNIKNATKTTGNDILNNFGFKGGEFGNWVNQTERQEFLNYAQNAFTDLATALDIDASSLGQNNEMNIAFGSRGKGLTGAVAHFEPEKRVINMTRLKGAGSLAHEYGHSIDNYLSRCGGYDENGMATTNIRNPKLSDNMKIAINNVINSIKYNVSTNQEEITKKNEIYEKGRRSSLETHLGYLDNLFSGNQITYKYNRKTKQREQTKIAVTDKQKQKYQEIRKILENGKLEAKRTFIGRSLSSNDFEYAEPIENLKILYKEVVGRKINDDTIYWLYRYGQPTKQVTQVKSESAFSKSALELDRAIGRKSSYYSTTEEMWARAFEAYIADKLKSKGITNTYLVHSVNNSEYALFNPFPAGEERKNINKAFDNLIQTMKEEGYYKPTNSKSSSDIKHDEIRAMKVTKKYNNYTQKELANLNSPKIRIANSEKDVLNFIETAKKIPNNLKLYFGKIDTYIANKIQGTLGINVTNYNISLKTDAIRHIMNNHTNSNRENSRGQIPITSDDILNIPDIINNYDTIKKSGTTEQNKDTITFEKNIDGNTVVVTYVSDKHNNLEIQTMYKFKNNKKRNVSPASNVPSTLNPTSETVSSIVPSKDSIPQNGKNVKDDGIRSMKQNTNKVTDSEGRTLTKQQQEYFKDSKVRDENGNLLVMYHGTEANVGIPENSWFTVFDIDRAGNHGSMLGDGFYFTSDRNHAEQYSHTKGNIYETYLSIKNPLELNNFSTGELAYAIRYINPYIDADIYKRDGTIDGYKVRKYLLDNGYDGIHSGNTYVAFNSSQIKNITNSSPTSNDDIRYMKKNNYKNQTKNKDIRFAKRTAKPKEEIIKPGVTNAQRDTNYIEQEIRKIEESGKWDESIPVTKMTDIRKTIENYLGLGIQKGHFRQQAYGIYKGNRDVIRTKELKDIDTILHETGHALDIGKRIKIDKESIANELLKAVNNYGGYETESREIRLEEGFAEVIRMYTIVPEQAKIEYPQTVSVLEGIRNENADFDNFIRKIQEQTYNYIHQRPRNRGGLSNMSIGEQTDKIPLTPESVRQRVIENAWDSNYSIKRAVEVLQEKGNSQELKASENAYLLTRLTSGIGDKITSMLSNGYIDENGNKLFPGLNQLGELLNNDIERFNDLRAYLVAQRDLEYKAKKLKTGIRTMDSKAIVEELKNDTQIQEASKIIYDTLDGVLQYAVNNKLITPNNAKVLRESNAFYVPMQRVLGTTGNNVGRKGAVADIIKARTGSELDIKDVLENIVTNSANIIQQVENNLVIKALYNQGESVGLTGSIYDEIDPPMKKIGTTNLETWKSELESQGVDINKIDFDKTIDIFVPNNNIDEKNQIVSFIDNRGQRRYLQFHDEILFKTLTGLDRESTSRVLNFFDKLNKPLRYGATLGNLGFALPNMLSDTVQASIYSEAGFIPIIDTAIGTLDVLASKNKTVRNFMNKVAPQYADKVNMMYYLYEQSGATSATKIGQERKSAQMLMKDIYGTNNSESLGIKENFKPLKRLLDIMTYIPELSEQSTRFRVFEKNLEYYRRNGMEEIDARIQAALQSRDATQDFSRMGKSMREVNKLVPFSAARVGSSYTFLEKIQANPKRTSMRIAILMAISMGIKALTSDDDEINELNQRKKDDNFVFKIGEQIITIKKPQGILRSMINLSDYIIDLTSGNIEEGKEGERLAEWLCNAIMDNSIADDVTGLVPSAITPIVENAINKDFYYNTDIVKSYDLELPDSEQYYDYNSQLAIWLGKIFNYSPAKIDNFISGYFAGLGTQVTNIIDWMLSKTGVIPEKPYMGLESNSIGKRFFINANTNSASLDELYDLKTELTKKKNGNTITDEETKQLENINNALSNMTKLNKQIKEIKKDLTMSGEEKAEKIKILQKQKTDTARSTVGKELLYPEIETENESITFYPSRDTISQNRYVLNLTSDMKKEYEQLAYNKYKQYENHGLYSKEKLEKLKEKSKDYAKSQLIKKYKNDLIKK